MTLTNQIENQTEKRNRKPREFYKNRQGKGRFTKDYEQAALAFLGLHLPNDLCSYLKVDFYAIQDLIAKPSYRHYFIPKKSGGNRQIDAPNQLLKRIQKKNKQESTRNLFRDPTHLCPWIYSSSPRSDKSR